MAIFNKDSKGMDDIKNMPVNSNALSIIAAGTKIVGDIDTDPQTKNPGDVKLGDYMFSSYYDEAIGLGDSIASGIPESWNQDNMHMLLITSVVSSAIFLAIAYRVFTRRDLNG